MTYSQDCQPFSPKTWAIDIAILEEIQNQYGLPGQIQLKSKRKVIIPLINFLRTEEDDQKVQQFYIPAKYQSGNELKENDYVSFKWRNIGKKGTDSKGDQLDPVADEIDIETKEDIDKLCDFILDYLRDKLRKDIELIEENAILRAIELQEQISQDSEKNEEQRQIIEQKEQEVKDKNKLIEQKEQYLSEKYGILIPDDFNSSNQNEIFNYPSLKNIYSHWNKNLQDLRNTNEFCLSKNITDSYLLALITSLIEGSLILLNGSVGVGKTSLVKQSAKILGNEKDHNIIPVRPAWLDPSDLFGYYDSVNNIFRPSSLTTAIKNAKKNKLHLICLDELNLARIENYGSDLLSQLEYKGDIQLYSNDIYKEICSEKRNDETYPSTLKLSEKNLVLIGTLNSDETTYQLSPKVIDRSFVITFPVPFLDDDKIGELPNNSDESTQDQQVTLDDWFDKIKNQQNQVNIEDDWNIIKEWNQYLVDNKLAIPLGYRAKNLYKTFKNISTILRFNQQECLGHFLFMKIMPRIYFIKNEGNESKQALLKKWLEENIKDYHGYDPAKIIDNFNNQINDDNISNVQYFSNF